MSPYHSTGAIQALYRVFVLPSLSPIPPRLLLLSSQTVSAARICQHRSGRPFATTAIRKAKTREPEVRKEKWDEEITAKRIYLIDSETGRLTDPETGKLPRPVTRYDVLSRIDRNTHRLVQVPHQIPGQGEEVDENGYRNPNFIAVCKIVSKKAAYDSAKRRKQENREKKKTEAAGKSLKTLELNWAIDQNDLGHRLEKVKEFLAEGRKVEVILANKKRGRKASAEECEEVLRRIRDVAEGVEGARETKTMEGRVGAFATLSFQGRMPQQQAQAPDGG